jgi:small multidrug resistance pump
MLKKMQIRHPWAWLFLCVALIFGCIANGLLKKTEGFTNVKVSIICSIAIVLCAACLSKAMQSIPIGVVYATYAAIVIVCMTFIGFSVYKQSPNCYSVLGFVLIIVGTILLHTMGNYK